MRIRRKQATSPAEAQRRERKIVETRNVEQRTVRTIGRSAIERNAAGTTATGHHRPPPPQEIRTVSSPFRWKKKHRNQTKKPTETLEPPPPPTPPLRCTGRLKRAGCFKLSTRWRDGRRSRPVSAEPSELGVPQTYLADRIRSSRPPHPQSDPLRSVRMRRKPREDTAGHVLVRQGIRNSYRAHSKKWSFETTRSQKKKPSQQQKMDASS